MKKLLIFIAPLLMTLTACEPCVKYEQHTWENHEIEVCGVKDPIENMDWLKKRHLYDVELYEYTVQNGHAHSYILSVYTNDTTGESRFVERTRNDFFGYDCNGEEVFDGGAWKGDDGRTQRVSASDIPTDNTPAETPIDECRGCEDFFSNHTFQYTIAEYICKPKNK